MKQLCQTNTLFLQINFNPSLKTLEKDSIGILLGFKCKFVNIKSIDDIEIPHTGKFLQAIPFENDSSSYILTTNNFDLLNFVSLDGQCERFSHSKLKRPVVLCSGKDGSLFIGENLPWNILVFNKKLEFIDGFDISVRVKNLSHLACDLEDTNSHLYASDSSMNKISVFDYETGIFIKWINLIDCSPSEMKLCKEKLYVVSTNLKEEANSILVLNKETSKIISEIRLDMCYLRGLELDDNFNIVTTALCMDEKHDGFEVQTLFVIDVNGNVLFKNELYDLKIGFQSLTICNDQLLALYDTGIKIIKF
jgi:hypothetical protein